MNLRCVSISIAAMLLLAVPAHAESAAQLRQAAIRGDYEAQRNLAQLLARGDASTPQNLREACAWREAIVASGYVSVHGGDVLNRNDDCGKLSVQERASAKGDAAKIGQEINRSIAPKTPGYGASIWEDDDFDDDEAAAKKLMALERKAFAGDSKAQRSLAVSLSSQAASDAMWHNKDEEACVWWRVVAQGGKATKEDQSIAKKVCGALGPEPKEVADARFARIILELKRTR